jgi:DNA-binding transcriptional ArsR family regulator
MKDLMILRSLDQIKALAHPLRQRLMEAFSMEPRTTKQVADMLGERPSRLYHHVAALEEAHLLELVETRQKRGTIEQYYQAAARKFRINRDLLEFAEDNAGHTDVYDLIVGALEDTLLQFQHPSTQRAIAAPSEKLVFVRAQSLKVTPAQIADLRSRLDAWLDDCQSETPSSDAKQQGMSHALTVVLYPTRNT